MVNSMSTNQCKLGWSMTLAVLSAVLFSGCHAAEAQKAEAQKDDPVKPAIKKVDVAKNVWLEIEGDKRRVCVNALVCRRNDQLEQFMCLKNTKEHEAIVAADIMDAAKIHFALTLAGADPGSPAKFVPKYQPARGTVIKVYVQYQEKGKTIKVPAQQWVRNVKTKKELDYDWVFAGSQLFQNRLDPKSPPFYAANDGDVICLANFDSAMLDLPIASTKDNDDLQFEAFTEHIPPLETRVVVILEPVLPAKKK
jgi:hypothetical protein